MICVTIIFSENMEMMQRYSLLLQIVYAIKVTQKMYLKYIKKMIQVDFWKILSTLMKLIKTLFENGKIKVNDKINLIPKT